MPIHEVMPLLLAAPTAAASAYFGISGYRTTNRNARTAAADEAAEQAKANRESRREAARPNKAGE